MSQSGRDDKQDDGRNGNGSAADMSLEWTPVGETPENGPEGNGYRPGNGVASSLPLESDGSPPRTASTDVAREQGHTEKLRATPALSISETFNPWCLDLTELGNARRLKDAYAPNVRWVGQKKAWIICDGGRWQWDKTGGVLQQGARQMIDDLQVRVNEEVGQTRAKQQRREAEALKRHIKQNQSQRSQSDQAEIVRQVSELLKGMGPATDDGSTPSNGRAAWVKKSQSLTGLRNMIALLQDEPGIAVDVSELDQNPDLLGVVNGVVDLRVGRLRAAARGDLITRAAATLYDPAAPAPQWEQFLEDVQPDPEIRACLGRAIGYSLTGHTREQCFFVVHGDGSTGKTTFLETIRFVLGEYAVGLPASSLTANKQSAIPNDLARLCGARFVPAAETNEFQHIDEALIKRLSGSDTIEARFLHKDFFSFQPTHKIWIATNHLPHVKDTGNGFWRRPVLISFDQKFAGDTNDKRMIDNLKGEAPGILAWIVRQCLEWQQQGLNTPQRLIQSVQDYRTNQDVVARFIADICSVGDGFFEPADPLYQAFQGWARLQGETVLSGTAFGIRLNELGHFKKSRSSGLIRCGLMIKSHQGAP